MPGGISTSGAAFPFSVHAFGMSLPLHLVFESLAYFIGFRLYLYLRSQTGDVVESGQRLWVITAAAVGAVAGAKVLNWFADPTALLHNWSNIYYLLQGKTVVGGLIGGLIAVELTKKVLGIRRRTGDLFAIPLAVGIAVGRIGCFLSGFEDDTYGTATTLPWAVDFGDGVKRHPAQIYEIMWLILLASWLFRLYRMPHREGDVFKMFMLGYFGFRLFVEFLKPGVFVLGLTSIQWACVAMLVYYASDVPYVLGFRKALTE
jgi:phosphatidylglycerol:prolipoprotein diacylglycerol transferase